MRCGSRECVLVITDTFNANAHHSTTDRRYDATLITVRWEMCEAAALMSRRSMYGQAASSGKRATGGWPTAAASETTTARTRRKARRAEATSSLDGCSDRCNDAMSGARTAASAAVAGAAREEMKTSAKLPAATEAPHTTP